MCVVTFSNDHDAVLSSLIVRQNAHVALHYKTETNCRSFDMFRQETKKSEVNVIFGCVRVFFLLADMYQS